MKISYSCSWIAIASVAFSTSLLSCSRSPWLRPNEKTMAAVQDEVYEAVVSDMIAPTKGQTEPTQLVFRDELLSDVRPGGNAQACLEAVRKRERWHSDAPPYNSFADKIYRLITHGWASAQLRTATIEDFLEKDCNPGHLSRTFHTGLPKSFVASDNVHFAGWPIQKNGSSSFEKLFPGASGIISLSRAGFDPALDESMVSASFVCGGLCGEGWEYKLKKRRGKWQVVSKRMVWIS
jgi:hypothetical protein